MYLTANQLNQKKVLEASILADLHDSTNTYMVIAVKHQVGYNRVAALAMENELTRPRGKKPKYANHEN